MVCAVCRQSPEQRRQRCHRARAAGAGTEPTGADDRRPVAERTERSPIRRRFDQRVDAARCPLGDRRRDHLAAAAQRGLQPEAIDAEQRRQLRRDGLLELARRQRARSSAAKANARCCVASHPVRSVGPQAYAPRKAQRVVRRRPVIRGNQNDGDDKHRNGDECQDQGGDTGRLF